jgi:hypothetical protein
MLEEIQMDEELTNEPDKVIKKWKAKIENKSLDVSDIVAYFQHSAPYFLTISRKDVASDVGESPEIYCFCGKIREQRAKFSFFRTFKI